MNGATRALALVTVLASCAGGGGSGAPAVGGGGSLEILATDAPIDPALVAEAKIWVDTVRIHHDSDAEDGFDTLYSGAPIEIDLLHLRNGVTRSLLVADLPPGSYHQLRLRVASGYLKLVNGNEYSTAAGNLDHVPQSTAGLKVFIDPPIVVQTSLAATLLLDFDLTKTFKPVPANDPPNASRYKLHPSIRAVNLSQAGELRGLVVRDDGAGSDEPVADAAVYVLPPGATDLEQSVATTMSDADGSFAVLGLRASTYDVLAIEGGEQGRLDAVGIVAANVTDVVIRIE